MKTDELDILKRALGERVEPSPLEAARAAAIAVAMQAFDQEIASAPQGSGVVERLKRRASAVLASLGWRPSMQLAQPRLAHVLAAGASLAVLAVAVLNTDAIRHPRREAPPVPAERRADSPKPVEQKQKAEADSDLATPAPAPYVADALEAAPPVAQPAVPGLAYAPRARTMASPRAAGNASSYDGAAKMAAPQDSTALQYRDQGRDRFSQIAANPVKVVKEDPVSTFSIDVDTASYSFVRASLNQGVLPQKDAVRVEEFINYFPYDYTGPTDKSEPFKASVSVLPTPWNTSTKLVRIGIKGYTLHAAERPRANLVFLIDTSGSMDSPDKLPLLRNAFRLLLSSLSPEDTVAIVTYAGNAGTVLEPTKAKDTAKILVALDNLDAGGSTAGAEGIRQAYRLAEQTLDKSGVNRVILATDSDFNVGITDLDELKSFVERKRRSGVSLSVLGFGMGNYNDELMQALAQNGNGNASYIDTLNEARKALVDQAAGTLFTIAQDVKIQVEFNPAAVSEYRLIGYETRMLAREDFNNDKVDAGDIGAGHTVTALYEITPAGSSAKLVDGLRYQQGAAAPQAGPADEYAFLKIRYKLPDETASKLITTPIGRSDESATVEAAPQEARFAAAVAAFGQLLRGGRYTGGFSYDDVTALAQAAKGADSFGYRADFLNLVRLAQSAAALEPLRRQ